MKINRLSKESSPYLLQHKSNPVNWYPWNSNTLSLIKNNNKPVNDCFEGLNRGIFAFNKH